MDDDDDNDDSGVVVFSFACALLCTPSARRALPRCSLFVTIRISHLNLNQIQSPEVFTLGIASQSTRDRRKLFPCASSRDDVDDARRAADESFSDPPGCNVEEEQQEAMAQPASGVDATRG